MTWKRAILLAGAALLVWLRPWRRLRTPAALSGGQPGAAPFAAAPAAQADMSSASTPAVPATPAQASAETVAHATGEEAALVAQGVFVAPEDAFGARPDHGDEPIVLDEQDDPAPFGAALGEPAPVAQALADEAVANQPATRADDFDPAEVVITQPGEAPNPDVFTPETMTATTMPENELQEPVMVAGQMEPDAPQPRADDDFDPAEVVITQPGEAPNPDVFTPETMTATTMPENELAPEFAGNENDQSSVPGSVAELVTEQPYGASLAEDQDSMPGSVAEPIAEQPVETSQAEQDSVPGSVADPTVEQPVETSQAEQDTESVRAVGDDDGQPDDLLLIEGIGPRTSTVVTAAGYTSFAALAAADVEQLRQMLQAANVRTVDPSTWPEQARLASEGRMEELRELQRQIKNGKKQK